MDYIKFFYFLFSAGDVVHRPRRQAGAEIERRKSDWGRNPIGKKFRFSRWLALFILIEEHLREGRSITSVNIYKN